MKEPDPNSLILQCEFSLKVRRRICLDSSTFPFTHDIHNLFFPLLFQPCHITYHIRVSKIHFKIQFTLFISISPHNVKFEHFFIDSTNFSNNILLNTILVTSTCIFPHLDTVKHMSSS